jgi:NhaP-type Na+/H+ and K+/H+ antiporter
MTPLLFLLDFVKQLSLGLIIGTPVLVAVLWLMARTLAPAVLAKTL